MSSQRVPTPASTVPVARRRAGGTPRPAAGVSPRRRAPRLPYVLLLPAVAILLVALGYPVVWQVVTSMQKYGLAQQFGKPATWVGLGNYVALAKDPYLWTVVGRSLVFCLVNALVTLLLGLLVALLMKAVPAWARISVQVSMLLAWATPVITSMAVWRWLFDYRRGVVNYLLTQLGFDFVGHSWLEEPLSFFFVATVIVVWASVPFVAFSAYAGLTQVPGEVLEAAQIDGAGPFGRFRWIVLPMIRPVLSIVLLLQVIWDLRVFAQIRLLQDAGGTPSATNLLGTYIYQLGIGSGDFGRASAVSIFVLLLTIALSWYYVRGLLKEGEPA